MKKIRGQRRYFNKLLNGDLEEYFARLDFYSWFDFWHDHPDWSGLGNTSWNHRKPHLKALLRRFDFLKTKLLNRKEDFQTFCIVDIDDSSQDAIYIHTKNPNYDNFPTKFEQFDGDINILSQLRELIDSSGNDWFFHQWNRENEIVELICIYDKNVGIPIS
ncbi:MAG: hypothetical protein GY795_32200 [Desulfobacterales bacterium]|nr:hypothetical protein [Desulfobacterales bacterium]